MANSAFPMSCMPLCATLAFSVVASHKILQIFHMDQKILLQVLFFKLTMHPF